MTAVDWKELLGNNGPLTTVISGFNVRSEQQEMAQAVGAAMQDYGAAVIEAGTGVGKTFAYLVPALSSGGKVIVSTGTKTLQDQLFIKDLPLVKKALKTSAKLALLKGRSNYLCNYRLRQALAEGSYKDRRSISQLHRINDWAAMTDSGDISQLSYIPANAEVRSSVTSTADNCLGAECEDYANCYVANARRKAQEADVVVVNHHLFFADLALKEEGFGELLPSANTVILDEAHQLPEIASTFFSEVLSSRQLRELCRDILAETLLDSDMPELRDQSRLLDKTVQDLRLAMDKPGLREPWHKIRSKPAIVDELDNLCEAMDELEQMLDAVQERGKGLQTCHQRLQLQRKRLKDMNKPPANSVQWYETFTRSFSLISTPLNVADPFRKQMQSFPCSWIFTSATLAVGKTFEHFNSRMGIDDAEEVLLDSPFDYWHKSLLYSPKDIPEPQHVDFVPSVVDASIPVIEACTGGTFMLFTSYRALNMAAELLKDEIDRPVLVQGESSQHEMIDKFRELGNAILLGTGSFWEGVDVRGDALSCVIIDKLPFGAPNDPVMEARIQAIRDKKGNPFYDYQLPQAVIALKQGVGRLIRDSDDRGVLMICDPRLRTRSYGSVFLESLPRIPRTQKIEVVERFFAIGNDENTGN
jgi:ATP-dependent DNA helicase DinG